MGNEITLPSFGSKKETNILVVGLWESGKTTLLYKLSKRGVETEIPMIGFNVESTSSQRFHLTSWDVGGRDKTRPLTRHYLGKMDGCVFMVDSANRDSYNLDQARDEIRRLIEYDEVKDRGLPVLVLANKQDVAGCMSAEDLAAKLDLGAAWYRDVHVDGCPVTLLPVSALRGDGLQVALDWLQRQAGVAKDAWQARHEANKDHIPPRFHVASRHSLLAPLSGLVKRVLGPEVL